MSFIIKLDVEARCSRINIKFSNACIIKKNDIFYFENL